MPSMRTFWMVIAESAAALTSIPSPVYWEWEGSGFLISTPSMYTSPVEAGLVLMLMPWQTLVSVRQGVVRSISPPMMVTLWPPSMSRPPTTGTLGRVTIQSLVLSRPRYWWLPVSETYKVAQVCVASPQGGGAQLSGGPLLALAAALKTTELKARLKMAKAR